jgi:sugar-specific transcriptional regulator TrmB
MKEKLRVYRATDPQNLLIELEHRERDIRSLVPELKAIEKLAAIPQQVTVYEGREGLRVLMEEILKTKELLFFGGTGRSYDVLRWEMPHMEKEIVKRKFKVRGVMHKKYATHKMTLLPGLEVRYLEDTESDATTTIFGDTVGVHVLLEKPLVIIIKNKTIAEGYRNYFEFMWRSAKK